MRSFLTAHFYFTNKTASIKQEKSYNKEKECDIMTQTNGFFTTSDQAHLYYEVHGKVSHFFLYMAGSVLPDFGSTIFQNFPSTFR